MRETSRRHNEREKRLNNRRALFTLSLAGAPLISETLEHVLLLFPVYLCDIITSGSLHISDHGISELLESCFLAFLDLQYCTHKMWESCNLKHLGALDRELCKHATPCLCQVRTSL